MDWIGQVVVDNHSWQPELTPGLRRVPALGLEAVTKCDSAGQVGAQAGGVAQIGMAHRLLLIQPGMGQ